jgi:hypothetical protein
VPIPSPSYPLSLSQCRAPVPHMLSLSHSAEPLSLASSLFLTAPSPCPSHPLSLSQRRAPVRYILSPSHSVEPLSLTSSLFLTVPSPCPSHPLSFSQRRAPVPHIPGRSGADPSPRLLPNPSTRSPLIAFLHCSQRSRTVRGCLELIANSACTDSVVCALRNVSNQ